MVHLLIRPPKYIPKLGPDCPSTSKKISMSAPVTPSPIGFANTSRSSRINAGECFSSRPRKRAANWSAVRPKGIGIGHRRLAANLEIECSTYYLQAASLQPGTHRANHRKAHCSHRLHSRQLSAYVIGCCRPALTGPASQDVEWTADAATAAILSSGGLSVAGSRERSLEVRRMNDTGLLAIFDRHRDLRQVVIQHPLGSKNLDDDRERSVRVLSAQKQQQVRRRTFGCVLVTVVREPPARLTIRSGSMYRMSRSGFSSCAGSS